MKRIQRILACLILASALMGGTASAQPSEQETSEEVVWVLGAPSDLVGHPAERLFQWAITTRILDGYPDGRFKPDEPISEAEFLKAFFRAFGFLLTDAANNANWTDDPYSLAKAMNYPALGFLEPEQRFKAITRGRAAEIVAAAQGVRYEGADAVVYVVGNGLTIGDISSPNHFGVNDALTRSDAIRWIRQLKLRGMIDIKARPSEMSDREKLPAIPNASARALPDFSTVDAIGDDFKLLIGATASLQLGDVKDKIDGIFGVSDEKDITDQYSYPFFRAHYNDKGMMDYWSVNLNTMTEEAPSVSLKTNKGIELGVSTLSDVLEQYGTAGYMLDGIATYLYEETDDGHFRAFPWTSSLYQIHSEEMYDISFMFDHETLKVTNISASWLPYSLRPF